MRRTLFIAALAILLGAPAGADDAGPAKAEPRVRFNWALGVRASSAPDKIVALTRDAALGSGSKLKLLIQPTLPCFVYVIHQGPDGTITPLFPKRPGAGAAVGDLHFIPPGSHWMTLDDETGTENFHLLASGDRLEGLERLLADRAKADAAAARRIDPAILEEIGRLRRSHPLSKSAKRPISIGGRLRSPDGEANSWLDQLGRLAVEITADEFFARTFTIEHR